MKEKLFDFENIIKIIKLCFIYNNEEKNISFSWNGKNYNIEKDNLDNISLRCNDGRELSITYDSYDCYCNIFDWINISYYNLNNGIQISSCNHSNTVDTNDSIENIMNLFDLNISVDLAFASQSVGENDTDLEPTINGESILFVPEGLRVGDYHFSKDGKRIISYKGEIVPSKEALDSYDFMKSKEKAKEALNRSTLDKYAKNILLKAFDEDGDVRKNINMLLDAYKNYVPSLEGYINIKNDILSGNIKKYVFSKEEMKFFYIVLFNVLNNKEEKTKIKN